jgi:hypothetical protein
MLLALVPSKPHQYRCSVDVLREWSFVSDVMSRFCHG